MRAAFALGAEGIQMGTRFLASEECHASKDYKNRIIKAKDMNSIVISRKIKHPTRVIKINLQLIIFQRNETTLMMRSFRNLFVGV